MAIYDRERILRAFEIFAKGQYGYEIQSWDHEGFIVCRCREFDIQDGEIDRQIFVKLTIIQDGLEFHDDPVTSRGLEYAMATWLAENGMPEDVNQFVIALDRVCFLVYKDVASIRWQRGAEPDA